MDLDPNVDKDADDQSEPIVESWNIASNEKI
jgi:hypothetical protein